MGPSSPSLSATSRARRPVGRLKPTGPIEDWQAFFQQEFDRAFRRGGHHALAFGSTEAWSRYDRFIEAVVARSAHWPPASVAWLRLHGHLYLLSRMEESNRLEGRFYSTDFIQGIAEELAASLVEIGNKGWVAPDVPIIDAAAETLRWQYLSSSSTWGVDWLYIFRLLWMRLFDTERAEAEAERLDVILEKASTPAAVRDRAILARAHFAIAADDDEGARMRLNRLSEKARFTIVRDLRFYLEGLSRFRLWERLIAWLRWLVPYAATADTASYESLCLYWNEVAHTCGVQEEFIEVLRRWLPRSRRLYSHYLVERKLYRDWAQLWIQHGTDFHEIDGNVLRLVEAHDPALLLPLYHQQAMRCIGRKNRVAYREAVELLKGLNRIYLRLSRGGEWERFMAELTGRFGRLRALMEELRKGTLISR
ncbi:hypothetical protein GTO89_13590 [Heliobacterium gestii]|uniref:Uncharacterized protein n=1 Tax=Heliomicrobium gestii TaxID=2699 RepID=A0A845LMF2_HELGE|nr:hypothetical protein [Heliomicrobium gestii]MBM7867673.1 hypothetical protein [Heliomicrobium gestii]MZP44066.1 hypothetical protein [Heliomicrobium gestii]